MNNFTANDIKAGYLGVLGNGRKVIAMPYEDVFGDNLTFVTVGCMAGGGADIDCRRAFEQKSHSGDYNLVALYGYPIDYDWFSTENRPLLWEREKETIEMTITEIEEKLGIKNLKIIGEGK